MQERMNIRRKTFCGRERSQPEQDLIADAYCSFGSKRIPSCPSSSSRDMLGCFFVQTAIPNPSRIPRFLFHVYSALSPSLSRVLYKNQHLCPGCASLEACLGLFFRAFFSASFRATFSGECVFNSHAHHRKRNYFPGWIECLMASAEWIECLLLHHWSGE